MTYTTWNPFRELEALRREVERAFESFGSEWRPSRVFDRWGRTFPLVNVSDDKDNVYVEALAPGVNPDSLEISVLRNTLRLAGEKQAVTLDVKPDAYHRKERTSGKFTRTITLPVEVEGGKVAAEYKNGVLTITLPKAEEAKPKQITVQVS